MKLEAPLAIGLAVISGAMFSPSAMADFSNQLVPIAVTAMYCDSNPRIVVEFSDSSQNVWYPANLGTQSTEFYATAMAAKTAGQNFFFYGAESGATPTSYCLSTTARQVYLFGLR